MSEGIASIEELERAIAAVENIVTGYGDAEEEFRGLVLMKAIADRLGAVIKSVATTLGEEGHLKANIDGVPYKLSQATSYKWSMPDLFSTDSAQWRQSGVSPKRTRCALHAASRARK